MRRLVRITERQLEILALAVEFAMLNRSQLFNDIHQIISWDEMQEIQDQVKAVCRQVGRDREAYGPNTEVAADIEIIKDDDEATAA